VIPLDLPILDQPRFRARFHRELRAATVIPTLQINLGYRCNLACRHCHVESSPARTAPGDNMDKPTARRVVEWALGQPSIDTVDLTGGSPEMNGNFRWMVAAFRSAGRHVMDRCNPTIIDSADPDTGHVYDWVPAFLAAHQVEVIASMPCYLESNVERQRGRGSYAASVQGLRRLNAEGYGRDPALALNLVYNPAGPSLPPDQDSLEADYKRELRSRFGIVFNRLWTITNMPIARWRNELERQGRLSAYMAELIGAFNADTIDGLMCRHQINIDPLGRLYDCDFNQAIGLRARGRESRFIWDMSMDELTERAIATDDHCYGCTAGCGSSCGGAIV
jgi:radical SAM/Cys-rich protein